MKKKYRKIKSKTCDNRSVQRAWIQKEEIWITTSYMESIMLASVMDTKEDRDVATKDITNLFIQTPIYRKPGEEKIIMKIKGVLVNMLVQTDPEKYGPNVVYEKGKKVLYLDLFKAIYGMLQSALLSYINPRKKLDTDGFKCKPYDPCVDNKIVEVEPLTVVLHADELKESHKEKKVVENFEQ